MQRSDQRTVAMLLAYDGGDFRGWQKQPGMRTVQGVLEEALSDLFGEQAKTQGAARTDAGVHARGQVAQVSSRKPWSLENEAGQEMFRALARALPPSLRLLQAAHAATRFHARASALGKRYRYLFRWGARAEAEDEEPAFHLGDSAQPDWERARAALQGLAPLEALPGLGSPSTDRRPAPPLTSWTLLASGARAALVLEAPAFRKHQVRNVAGHLATVALGLAAPETLQALAQRRRPWMGATAPPHGLCLEEVLYPGDLDPFQGGRSPAEAGAASKAESSGEG